MSIRGSHVVALQAVIENKCEEGECLIGVVKRGWVGGVCWAPRDPLISLHLNSLKNKLCRLQFFSFFLQGLVAMWTFSDFCLAFFPPFRWELLQSRQVIKDSREKKYNSPTYQHPAYIHTAPACLDTAHSLYSLTQKTKQATPSDVFLFTFLFFFFFCLLERSPVRHCNISIEFPLSLICVCSILVRKPKDWISH